MYFTASLFDRVSLVHGKQKFQVLKNEGETAHLFEDKAIILVGSHFGDWTLCGEVFKKKLNRKLAIVIDKNSSKKFQALLKKKNIFSKQKKKLINRVYGNCFLIYK